MEREQYHWKVASLLFTVFFGIVVERFLIHSNNENEVEIIVGVLSSRSNFDRRDTIRKTWFSYSSNTVRLKKYFIVGSKPCLLPVEDRLEERACLKWNSTVSDEHKVFYTSTVVSEVNKAWHGVVNQGFVFKVRHPIVVKRLGILDIVANSMERVTVSLKNAVTEEIIVKATKTKGKPGVLIDGYFYFPVETFVLPQGFEALVLVEDVFIHTNTMIEQTWNDGGGLIYFTQVVQNKSQNLAIRQKTFDVSATGVGFSPYDVEELIEHIENKNERTEQYMLELKKEENRLREEILEYGDIVLVDVVDVYKNLPEKLLKFFSWVNTNYEFKYVLKTDDDCVIDIEQILEVQNLDKSKNFWLSRFRFNWLVDRVGKWAELDYLAAVYPPFACGMGSVLSSSSVKWLASNSHSLHLYQGEDVSLGIWLAATKPDYINDLRWMCEKGCVNGSFNVGDLTIPEMIAAWNYLKTCSSLCGC